MQVAGAIFGGELLIVATAVTAGVFRVDFSDSVEGLVDISNVVDDKAESE